MAHCRNYTLSNEEDPMNVEVRIKGSLKADWSDWLDGLVVSNQANEETVLSGQLPDQAALLGLLNRIHGLNLQLLAFSQADDSPVQSH
ncbi:MAG: hypothetical protein IPK52_15800 [Chloroflexi bacterium]|nr:hypothetical protein [Chloroflexota bacterium]